MFSLPKRSRVLYLVLIIPILMAPKGKGCCGRQVPETDGTTDTVVQNVEQTLQVVFVDPSEGKPNTGFPATVNGSGFQSGASVTVGDKSLAATFVNDNTLKIEVPGLPAGSYDLGVKNPNGQSARLRSAIKISDGGDTSCSFVRIPFGFDSSSLSPEAKAQLDSAVPCLRAVTSKISVEGHCDERGTTDYNLALGERRAATVTRYLSSQGVAGNRMDAVSYGEERPVSTGHDEPAWALNRRVDIHVDR